MLTDTTVLAERLEAARRREREARAEAARIRRELTALSRRQEVQLLCTLGRAWMTLGERHAGFRESGHRFLISYVTRDTDREILRGTPWEVPDPASHAVPEPEPEAVAVLNGEGGHVGD